MEYARGDEPPGAGLEAVGAGEVKDSVVTLVPVLDAATYLLPRCSGFEAHEGVREVVPYVVVLGREVIGFWLAFLTHQFGLLCILVHVVGDRTHVVEELRINRPLAVFAPNRGADEVCTALRHRLLERETVFSHDHVGEPFVGSAIVVCRRGRGGEPTLVDSTSVEPKCVKIVRMQLQTLTWLKE